MRTTAKAAIGNRTRTVNLRSWARIAQVLLAGISLAACGPGSGAGDVDGGASTAADSSRAPDSSVASTDAHVAAEGSTTQAVDGGALVPPPNQTCTVGAQCASGFCVDGVCCDRACDRSCESCALTGKVGTCSPIKNAADDTCGGDSMCDVTGACRKLLGKACSFSSECASGNCVDSVCCGSAACGACQACAVPGSEGTCAPVPKFTDDVDSSCSGDNTCDGLGACRSKNGIACDGSTKCTSLNCVDGVCCNDACDGTCYSCNQQGSVGTCKPIDGDQDLSATVACTASGICTAPAGATPACKIKDGEACTSSADCLNGSCITSYRDGDHDGYGHDKVTRCERAPAAGYALTGGDCCDSDPAAHPGVSTFSPAADACGSFDRNCDGRAEQQPGGTAPTCGCVTTGIGGKLGGTQLCTACR